LLKRIGVKEKEAVKELEKYFLMIMFLLYKKVVAWIAEKAKLPETSVRKILEKIGMKTEKFKTDLEVILAKDNRNRV
jgi:hypothetical protein